MKRKIVNIINFIRGSEPRDSSIDLLDTVKNQINILKSNHLPATFLIQYDALISKEYQNLLKNELNENYEIGAWFEIVQPLVEKAGITWRGRKGYVWDWYANVGCTIGYTPEERRKLIDVYMEEFKLVFGIYPESVGSWLIDSFTLNYMSKNYNIVASCNCRDQWGTDGYTLWGGYYNQAYYPSFKNVFTPAQNIKNQIPVPIFRMLGSDPIYQYDAGLIDEFGTYNRCEDQPVYTLEPSCKETGGNPKWINWYLKQIFDNLCLSFGYAQIGQENSFGWDVMRDGYKEQIKIICEKLSQGKLSVEKLSDSGKWFKTKFKLTPSSVVAALSDWTENGCKSIWYSNRFYRINFFSKETQFWIRDLNIFNENYEDRYLSKVCEKESLIYDNLPICDGNRWSKGKIRAGIYAVEIIDNEDIEILEGGETNAREIDENDLEISWSIKKGGNLKIICENETITITRENKIKPLNWSLNFLFNNECYIPIIKVCDNKILYKSNNYDYCLKLLKGNISVHMNGSIIIRPNDDKIVIKIH